MRFIIKHILLAYILAVNKSSLAISKALLQCPRDRRPVHFWRTVKMHLAHYLPGRKIATDIIENDKFKYLYSYI